MIDVSKLTPQEAFRLRVWASFAKYVLEHKAEIKAEMLETNLLLKIEFTKEREKRELEYIKTFLEQSRIAPVVKPRP